MKHAVCWLLTTLLCTTSLFAEDAVVLQSREGEPGLLDTSLQNEAAAAIARSIAWLESKQSADGSWSNPEFPALTALPLWSLSREQTVDKALIKKATKYILSCVHDNGAIYKEPSEKRKGGGLSTYNTAICMVALHEVGDPALKPILLKARAYIDASQHLGGDIYNGGMGYDASTGRAYADLSNTYIAYEAMRITEDVEESRTTGEKADLDWVAAQEFLANVQNLPETNKQAWVSKDPDERGGFVYRPDQSQAGSYKDKDGVVRFRTYGSMTYAGLLSLIYSDIDRDDVRVRSAFDWAVNHWTLDENPGMGSEGLYYFYNVLTKCLAAYGRNQLRPDGQDPVNWRAAVVKRLIALQKIDPDTGHGYWVNEQGRWWEADPVLTTSYALLALQIASDE